MTLFRCSRYGDMAVRQVPRRLTRGDTAGVPIAKFVGPRGTPSYELRDRRTRAKLVVLAWFFGFEGPGARFLHAGFKSATLAGTVAHGG